MRILYIDDDVEELEFFRQALLHAAAGAECITLNDSTGAIAWLDRERSPDVIFLDLNMPVLGGRDLLSLIKRRDDCSSIPVIIYSSSINSKELGVLTSLGASMCLQKAYSIAGLSDQLKILLRTVVHEEE